MRLLAARRNLVNAERLGQSERAKRAKARVAELEKADKKAAAPTSDLTKAELLDRAAAADIEGRSSMNKDELVEALED
jgi:hypothetical protein